MLKELCLRIIGKKDLYKQLFFSVEDFNNKVIKTLCY